MFRVTVLLFSVFKTVQCSNATMESCEVGYGIGADSNDAISTDKNYTAFDVLSARNTTASMNTTYSESSEGEGYYHGGKNDDLTEEDVHRDAASNRTISAQHCPHDLVNKTNCSCDSVFTPLNFWGANVVIFAILIYLFPYLIVVVLYFAIPDLRNRAYDKAVLCFNVTQLAIIFIQLPMGYFVLCHKPMNLLFYIPLGLTLMFLIISTVFWMFIICLDMTLVITRLRWVPPSDVKGKDEEWKFYRYSIYAFGVPLIATAIAGFMELCPWVPESSPLKPNFERFNDGVNWSALLYVFVLPVISLVLSNVLFVYTTYKIIKIRKSTAIATENRKNNIIKKYFVFLRLYLVMDAPWIFGLIANLYTNLWILKFFRMAQPILMLLAILPKEKLYQALKCSKRPLPERKRMHEES